MDTNKLTQKAMEAIQSAQNIAIENGIKIESLDAEMLPGFYFVSSLGGTDKSIIPIGVSVFLPEYMIRIRTL